MGTEVKKIAADAVIAQSLGITEMESVLEKTIINL